MARKKHYRRPGFTLPLAIVGGFMPMAVGAYNRRSTPGEIPKYLLASLTGYYPGVGWNAANMKDGALPLLAGMLAHKLAGRLGINRLLARARVPVIRI